MKVYVLSIIEEVTSVFSTREKAYAALIDHCRKDWNDLFDDEDTEIPENDNELIAQYFEQLGYQFSQRQNTEVLEAYWNMGDGDGYTIEEFEVDARVRESVEA
jgi:hypothetical protein